MNLTLVSPEFPFPGKVPVVPPILEYLGALALGAEKAPPASGDAWQALIFEVAGLKPELRPTNEREYRTAARRPKYSALSNARMEALGIAPMPPLREALEDYFRLRKNMLTAQA